MSSSREEIANNNSNENINNDNDAILNNNAIFMQLTQEENALGANNMHKKKHKLNNDNSFARDVDCHAATDA